LLDSKWHAKVADFGDSKVIDLDEIHCDVKKLEKQLLSGMIPDEDEENNFNDFDFNNPRDQEKREKTFTGTPLYVSPEMLNMNLACYGSDIWALGCIIYQCLTGEPPFKGCAENQIFSQILD
jgi:serine/threonine protein kinase